MDKVKEFKGLCRKCGVYEHKSADCPEEKEQGHKGKCDVTCYYCGEKGHYAGEFKGRLANERGNIARGIGSDDESIAELGLLVL